MVIFRERCSGEGGELRPGHQQNPVARRIRSSIFAPQMARLQRFRVFGRRVFGSAVVVVDSDGVCRCFWALYVAQAFVVCFIYFSWLRVMHFARFCQFSVVDARTLMTH